MQIINQEVNFNFSKNENVFTGSSFMHHGKERLYTLFLSSFIFLLTAPWVTPGAEGSGFPGMDIGIEPENKWKSAKISDNMPIAFSPDTSANDSTRFEPYETHRSLGYHALALPSYLLHWATRPIGAGIKFAERKLPELFSGPPGDFAVYPWLETGGDKGFTYGLLVLHNNILDKGHQLRYEMRFGSAQNNDFDLEYTVFDMIGSHSSTELSLEYGKDSNDSFFPGNDIPLSQDKEFSTEVVEIELDHRFFQNKNYQLIFNPKYRNVLIREGLDLDEEDRLAFPDSLKGESDIFSFNTSFRVDHASGQPRRVDGYRLLADIGISQSLNVRDITYLNYRFEWQEFIPIPFLPESRRLAFRGFLTKVENLQDRPIPFFDKPALGSSRTLRGFDNDRVREDAALHFTLEYRFPIWSFMDGNLFMDTGQVFNKFNDVAFNDFQSSFGFGFHIFNSKEVSVRAEFAFSDETSRSILIVGGNF